MLLYFYFFFVVVLNIYFNDKKKKNKLKIIFLDKLQFHLCFFIRIKYMGNTIKKRIVTKLKKTNKSSSSSLKVSSIEEINLETFLLVWLDPNVNTSEENRTTQKLLQNILTSLSTFDNIELCEEWFKKYNSNQKIILIVSGAYGEELVPKIHYLPSIISIIVYCLDVKRNQPWTKNYPKIQSIVSKTPDLLKHLSENQTNLESIEDSKTLQIYSLDTKTTSYIWYKLFLEILLSSDYLSNNSTFNELLQILREYSINDEYGLNLISQFEQTYQPKQAVSWLIRDTPLKRFVNKALREQDIHMLFILRFLLINIHNQLINHQVDSVNVYRIQPMMKSQMDNLLTNQGQLLLINGFLFASTDMSKVLSTVTNNDQFEFVLFNIKAKYRSGVVPFAFIHDIDSTIDEKIERNILFMCGSIFLVGPLLYKNSIWTLDLTLISDYDVPDLFQMQQNLIKNHNLCIIGDLLHHCKQSNNALIYYQRLLNELPKQHILISEINKHLSKFDSFLDPINDIQFILVNLSSYMTDFSSAMLGTLCSLTSDVINIYNDEIIDLSKWSNQSILLFTTAQYAESLKNPSKNLIIFTLENDKTKIKDLQHQFTTIEDLINQLADEIIQKYRLEAHKYHKLDHSNTGQYLEDKANKIFRELINLHKKFTTKSIPSKIFDTIEPKLILLLPTNEDMKSVLEYFKEFFSSYLFFDNEHKCHRYIVEHENDCDIFLIIYTNSQQSITNNFQQFSNIKQIYLYGKSSKIFQNQNDLYYRIIYDLIGYYAKLGDKYEMNNQTKLACQCFLKGQKLCQFLTEHFF